MKSCYDYNRALSSAKDPREVRKLLQELTHLTVNTEGLMKSGLGKTVASLKKKFPDLAKPLIRKWKALLLSNNTTREYPKNESRQMEESLPKRKLRKSSNSKPPMKKPKKADAPLHKSREKALSKHEHVPSEEKPLGSYRSRDSVSRHSKGQKKAQSADPSTSTKPPRKSIHEALSSAPVHGALENPPRNKPPGRVMSLVRMCVLVARRKLSYVTKLPYLSDEVLADILFNVTPKNLKCLDEHNPDLQEQLDVHWQVLCRKKYNICEKAEGKQWREVFREEFDRRQSHFKSAKERTVQIYDEAQKNKKKTQILDKAQMKHIRSKGPVARDMVELTPKAKQLRKAVWRKEQLNQRAKVRKLKKW